MFLNQFNTTYITGYEDNYFMLDATFYIDLDVKWSIIQEIMEIKVKYALISIDLSINNCLMKIK